MRRLVVTVIGFLLVAPITFGQMPDLDPERRAQLERRGAGLQIGAWLPGNLPEVADAEYSVTPLFTGFFRQGLDRHLAWENTVSFWMRRQSREFTDITGATREERVTTAIVPLLTSLTFYPATGPEATVEPFIRGGVGFVLGVDNRRGTSGGLFGIAGQEGTVMFTGVGARGGLGVDARLSRVFGLTAAAQYQWVHFLEGEPGGQATYHGPAIEVGLIYRFQF